MPRNVDGEIIVGIDIPASTKIVESDIRKLLQNLTTLEAKINHADLTDNAKQELRKQINDIKNLTANVEHLALDDTAKQEFRNAVGKVNNLTANIQNVKLDPSFQKNLQTALNGLTGLTINISGFNINPNAVKNAGQQVGKLISDSAMKTIDRVTSEGIEIPFTVSSQGSQAFKDQMKKLVADWTNNKGALTDIKINTSTSWDNKLQQNVEKLTGAVVTYNNELGETIQKHIALRKIGEGTDKKGNKVDKMGFVETSAIYRKTLNVASVAMDKFESKQKIASARIENNLKRLAREYSDPNASKPINEQGHISSLATQYDKVKQAIADMRSASKDTFVDAELEAKKQISILQSLVKEYRNAETVASKMKAVDISSGVQIATADFNKLKADAQGLGLDITKLEKAFENLEKTQTASNLNVFNDALRTSRAELQALKSQINADSKQEIFNVKKQGLTEAIKEWKKLHPEAKNFNKEIDGVNTTVDSLLKRLKKVSTDADLRGITSVWEMYSKSAEKAYKDTEKIYQLADITAKNLLHISVPQRGTNNVMPVIEKMARDNNWSNFNVSGVQEDDGKIKKLTLTVTEATGEIKKFNLERRKMQSGGQNFNGLLQVGDVQVIKTATQAQYELNKAQRESDAKTLFSRQKEAYQEIWNIRKQLAKLDETDETNYAHVQALKEEEKVWKDICESATLQLRLYEDIITAQERSVALSEIKDKAQSNINIQQGKDASKIAKAEQQEDIAIANKLLSDQKRKYEEIWKIEKQIAYASENGKTNLVSQLSSRKSDLEKEYSIISKELDKYDAIIDREEQSAKLADVRAKAEHEILSITAKELDKMNDIAKKEEERLAKKAQSDHDAKQAMYEKLWFDYDNGNLNKVKTIDDNVANNTYATQINDLITKYKQYGLTVDQAEDKVRELRSTLATMSNADKSAEERIKAEERYQQALKKSQNEVKVYSQNQRGLATDQQRLALANTMEAFLQKNTRITAKARQETEMYIATLRNLNSEMTVVAKNEINNSFKQMQNNMRVLGKLGYALKDQMKQATGSFVQWFSVSNLVMSGIYHGRSAITELKEIDTYLTEISKANNELTKSELADIGNRSFDIASNYGKTATDFLSAVQEASRAGYKNAEGIAELSTAAQGAGDMTSDVANQMLIATDKAYKMNGAVDLLRNTLDGMNFITNNNAVNMTELSEGMTIVASTAASFGVGVNELTAALGTMSATTQQSGSEVARAFRAILLNIRQVSDEEEGIDAEGLTKYERACNALGVKLKETKDGVLSLRDPMEVLKELSEEYVKLDESDIRRTNLLNSVGGKLRATQLDALLRQWSMYEKMLGEYEAGIGSMAVEAEKTANSWEGSLNRLSNTFADTIGNIANSDGVITLINSLNELLQIINKLTDSLGSFGSIGMIGSAILGGKGLG